MDRKEPFWVCTKCKENGFINGVFAGERERTVFAKKSSHKSNEKIQMAMSISPDINSGHI